MCVRVRRADVSVAHKSYDLRVDAPNPRVCSRLRPKGLRDASTTISGTDGARSCMCQLFEVADPRCTLEPCAQARILRTRARLDDNAKRGAVALASVILAAE